MLLHRKHQDQDLQYRKCSVQPFALWQMEVSRVPNKQLVIFSGAIYLFLRLRVMYLFLIPTLSTAALRFPWDCGFPFFSISPQNKQDLLDWGHYWSWPTITNPVPFSQSCGQCISVIWSPSGLLWAMNGLLCCCSPGILGYSITSRALWQYPLTRRFVWALLIRASPRSPFFLFFPP